MYVESDSWLMDSTAGDDFLGLLDQKILYKHVSESYGRLILRIEGKDY